MARQGLFDDAGYDFDGPNIDECKVCKYSILKETEDYLTCYDCSFTGGECFFEKEDEEDGEE